MDRQIVIMFKGKLDNFRNIGVKCEGICVIV